ncbi:MAG: PEP-CTERM sorting domain-containing protein [Verrucomicrobiota bacterium]
MTSSLKLKLLTITNLVLALSHADATIVATEDFDAANGTPVVDLPGWSAFSAADDSITVMSSMASIGSGAEDIELSFPEVTSGAIFFGITVNVSDAAASDYVMGFRDGTSLAARFFLDNVTGGFDFGVNTGGTGGSTAGAFAGETLTLNTNYYFVFSYDRVGTVNAWVDPVLADEGTPDVTFTNADAHSPDGFFFRQGGGWDNDGAAWTADNLVVSTTFAEAIPEPSSAILLSLVGALCIRRRRLL